MKTSHEMMRFWALWLALFLVPFAMLNAVIYHHRYHPPSARSVSVPCYPKVRADTFDTTGYVEMHSRCYIEQ